MLSDRSISVLATAAPLLRNVQMRLTHVKHFKTRPLNMISKVHPANSTPLMRDTPENRPKVPPTLASCVTNQKKTLFFFVNMQKMVSFVTVWPLRIGWFSTPTESQWWWVCRKKSSPRPHLLQNVWRQVLGRWWGHGLAWWCFLSEGPITIKDLTILLQHFKSLRYVIEEYW